MCLAVPGKILEIREPQGGGLSRMGRVDFSGIRKDIDLSYVPEALLGDYVIVHVGFAISVLDEIEALRVFDYLRQMEDLKELEA